LQRASASSARNRSNSWSDLRKGSIFGTEASSPILPSAQTAARDLGVVNIANAGPPVVAPFIASMMTHMWSYDGALDASEMVLTLDAEGPSFTGEGMAKYQDIIEFVDDNHRILTSRFQDEHGEWQHFMTAHNFVQAVFQRFRIELA